VANENDDDERIGETQLAATLPEILARAQQSYEQSEATLAARSRRDAERAAAKQAEWLAALPGRRRAWLLSLGVPELEAETVCAGLRRTRAVDLLAVISRERPILVLAGGTGCGKTCAAIEHLLTCAGPTPLRSQCESAGFITAVELGRLWPRFRDDRDRLLAIERVSALVVDDVGMEEDSLTAKLDHLIYQRAGNRRPTVITANMTAEEFRVRYDERVWSRLAQSGNFHGLEDEVDLRIQQRRGH
jgi:DNA replication protein DnaC